MSFACAETDASTSLGTIGFRYNPLFPSPVRFKQNRGPRQSEAETMQ